MNDPKREKQSLESRAKIIDGEVLPEFPLRFDPKTGTLNDKPYLRNGVIYSNPRDLAYGISKAAQSQK